MAGKIQSDKINVHIIMTFNFFSSRNRSLCVSELTQQLLKQKHSILRGPLCSKLMIPLYPTHRIETSSKFMFEVLMKMLD